MRAVVIFLRDWLAQVHVHYFEDGNLQLQTSKSVPAKSLSFDSETELGQKVVKHIEVSLFPPLVCH